MPDPPIPPERMAFYAQLAERAATAALEAMGYEQDAGPHLFLASAAWEAAMGAATPATLADLDEYELTDDGYRLMEVAVCICPPDLLARGGFKGGCPVHAG